MKGIQGYMPLALMFPPKLPPKLSSHKVQLEEHEREAAIKFYIPV
jgi:hypothetical protein